MRQVVQSSLGQEVFQCDASVESSQVKVNEEDLAGSECESL